MAPFTLLLLFVFVFFPALSFADRCRPNDKITLLKIKNSFSNPNVLLSWDPALDCCGWYVVECNETTNHVIGLTILYAQISGSIPDAVSDLTHLQDLRLKKLPLLVGTIPPAIGKLTNLVSLEISWTNISGPVPGFLSNLQNLEYLNLSFNKLSGSIPASLAALPNLSGIRLDRNRLTGSIPVSFGQLPGSRLYLILSHNGLSGELPASLGNVDFDTIDISRNNFSGDASVLFNASKTTTTIDISRNKFEFDFSRAGIMAGSLITLDISHNKIWGNIPRKITDAVNLQFLNVSYNRLCGEIPTGWRFKYRASNFDYSSFFHNRCLCGSPLEPCKP
ncbi:hypothetical protein HHK36_031674 [Tetracentron sinense]|uniref:Leucine-rich repeat-containing N-terminal plant-type domain-containing protein n=1 Tax=Tetracentron sinense TaxID=13715 RepID=A0A835CXU5_TETSI|nr:hypothetical protein HHK36_031674 [Tetracentron sinense]